MGIYGLPRIGQLVRLLGYAGTWRVLSVHDTGRVVLADIMTGLRELADVSQLRA